MIFSVARTALSILLAFTIITFLVLGVGDSPIAVFQSLWQSSFGSMTGLGYTLFYATPMIFTGLAVAVAYRSGLLNIGCEGQLYMGSLGMIATMDMLRTAPSLVAVPIGMAASMIFSGLWSAIPGALKAYRGSHEVIITIMMNFIAAGICNYAVLYIWKNPDNQVPETVAIAENHQWPLLSDLTGTFINTPANITFMIALLAVFLVYVFIFRTKKGFELRCVGLNRDSSRYAGINIKMATIQVMAISGMLAGMVSWNEILGSAHRFREGFSPGYGFTGIAVALLGRSHPIGILFAAILFGALHAGSINLELDTRYISRDLSSVMSAVIIVFVSIEHLWKFYSSRRKSHA